MLKLEIHAQNPAEMAKTLRAFAVQFDGPSPQIEMPVNTPATAEPKKEEPVKEAPKKKAATKAKAKKEEPKKEEPVKEEKAPKEEKSYTKKDITDACQNVAQTKSLDAAKEILQKFDAVRISEVKEADYAAFVSACNEAVA